MSYKLYSILNQALVKKGYDNGQKILLTRTAQRNAWCPQFSVSTSTQLWSFDSDYILAGLLSNAEFSAGKRPHSRRLCRSISFQLNSPF